MNDVELEVYDRGGYSPGSPAILKGNGYPAGCGDLRVGTAFYGPLDPDPSAPLEPPAETPVLTFRIWDHTGAVTFDVLSPMAQRSVTLASPTGRPIEIGEPVTLQWQPSTDRVSFEQLDFCVPTVGTDGTTWCLGNDGKMAVASAIVNPATIAGGAFDFGGALRFGSTLTFPMPQAPPGDGKFRFLNPGADPEVDGCPFGNGCTFFTEGAIVSVVPPVPASVAP